MNCFWLMDTFFMLLTRGTCWYTPSSLASKASWVFSPGSLLNSRSPVLSFLKGVRLLTALSVVSEVHWITRKALGGNRASTLGPKGILGFQAFFSQTNKYWL
jgi:hypothetical protein